MLRTFGSSERVITTCPRRVGPRWDSSSIITGTTPPRPIYPPIPPPHAARMRATSRRYRDAICASVKNSPQSHWNL
eukprot:8288343-Pyramimonas_sp.AAC.1